MKIGFDAKRAFNNVAGLGNFSRNTITALSRLYPDDQYLLFNPGSRRSLFKAPKNALEVRPGSIGWKIAKNIWRTFGISKIAKKLEVRIFHGLSHELPVGIEKTGIKSIVTIHDLIFLRYPEYFKKIDRKIYEKKFRHSSRVADRVHAISEQTKQDLITFFEIPESKIQVIYQSINPVFYKSVNAAEKKRIRTRYQLPEHFMLTVGTVEPRKNLMALLEAMVLSKKYMPLVVVGKLTDYQHKIQKFIEADLNRIQVFFLTHIQDWELAVLYQMAEVMIYPSFFEGFGLPVAEAQASGCPVITSKTSSLPEAGGDGAIYINPEKPAEIGEAIGKVLASKELRKELITKGKVNAQRFTAENFATQLKQLYNSVLNE
jgi:glycosyltransferase involved in cell wall biosynthesis